LYVQESRNGNTGSPEKIKEGGGVKGRVIPKGFLRSWRGYDKGRQNVRWCGRNASLGENHEIGKNAAKRTAGGDGSAGGWGWQPLKKEEIEKEKARLLGRKGVAVMGKGLKRGWLQIGKNAQKVR